MIGRCDSEGHACRCGILYAAAAILRGGGGGVLLLHSCVYACFVMLRFQRTEQKETAMHLRRSSLITFVCSVELGRKARGLGVPRRLTEMNASAGG